MRRAVTVVCFILAVTMAGVTLAAPEVKIVGFTYGGEGCPSQSIGYVYNPVTNVMTINFDAFQAWLQKDPSQSNPSNACTITFVVEVPNGFQVSLNRAQYLGYLDTEPTVRGELRRRYTYGTNPSFNRKTTFPEGYSDDFEIEDEFYGWSSCESNVTVIANTRLRVAGDPTTYGFSEIVLDTAQYGSWLEFYFNLQPCPTSNVSSSSYPVVWR